MFLVLHICIIFVSLFVGVDQTTLFATYFGNEPGSEKGIGIIPASDGGVIQLIELSGQTVSYLTKLSKFGNYSWISKYQLSSHVASSIIETRDGKLVVSGITKGSIYQPYIIKIDPDSTSKEIIWQNYIQDSTFGYTISFVIEDRSDFDSLIVAGQVSVDLNFYTVISKISSDGTKLIWSKIWGNTSDSTEGKLHHLLLCQNCSSDGSEHAYAITTQASNGYLAVVLFNRTGNVIWAKRYFPNDYPIVGFSKLSQANNSDLLIAGIGSGVGPPRFLFLRISKTGNALWSAKLENPTIVYGSHSKYKPSIAELKSGDIVLGATTHRDTVPTNFLMKVTSSGNSVVFTREIKNTSCSEGDLYGIHSSSSNLWVFGTSGYSTTIQSLIIKLDENGDQVLGTCDLEVFKDFPIPETIDRSDSVSTFLLDIQTVDRLSISLKPLTTNFTTSLISQFALTNLLGLCSNEVNGNNNNNSPNGGDTNDPGTDPIGLIIGSVVGGSLFVFVIFSLSVLLLILILVGCFFCCFLCIIFLIFCVGGGGIGGFFLLTNKGQEFNEEELETDCTSGGATLKIREELFEIDYDSIKLLSDIGSGGGGAVVYKAKWNGEIVAVKLFRKTSLSQENSSYEEFERELTMMASISHPSLLRWYGCTTKPPKIGIVMEFCENGDLAECILRTIIETIPQKIRVLGEIANGMQYLHNRKVAHRDLKPQNVLLDEKLHSKIMDFGLSKIISSSNEAMTKRIGTAAYMSPEITLGNQYSLPTDVFSYSIIIHVVLSSNLFPYGKSTHGISYVELKVANDPDVRPEVSEKVFGKKIMEEYSWLLELMKQSWSHDSADRPTFDGIVECFNKKKIVQ